MNLAPASLRKVGPVCDLPIAMGVLIAAGQLSPDSVEGAMKIGELSRKPANANWVRALTSEGITLKKCLALPKITVLADQVPITKLISKPFP